MTPDKRAWAFKAKRQRTERVSLRLVFLGQSLTRAWRGSRPSGARAAPPDDAERTSRFTTFSLAEFLVEFRRRKARLTVRTMGNEYKNPPGGSSKGTDKENYRKPSEVKKRDKKADAFQTKVCCHSVFGRFLT